MSIQTDLRETKAYADRETNPTLIPNWEFPVAFAMSQVGVAHLTTENLPLFMARQNVWYAAMGQRSPFHTDPTIPEMFIGMHVWGRHSEGDLTDAAFARIVTRIVKTTVMDLTRIYKNRKPGDFMHNLSLEDKIAGKCSTCPSHHAPNLVHDGEAENEENEERGDICMYLRAHGYPDLADDLGGETIETVRAEYKRITGKDWKP